MFLEHQPAISAWARQRPENLARVIQFAAISARQPFQQIPLLMSLADLGDKGTLFGWKKKAWDTAKRDAKEIFHCCEAIAEERPLCRERAPALVRYLAGQPGLNLAKAGFVAQLAYGCAGCLDSVNARRLSLPPAWFASASSFRMKRQTTPARRLALARWYCETCERLGGVARLWDEWCAEISHIRPEKFPTPHDASIWHWKCLGIA